jgi:DNA repair protein RadC
MREQEVFACVFLDAQHGVLGYEELFFGTVNAATVHPREIVKRSLALNACAAVVCHNHPSGQPEPSTADRMLTKSLQAALELVNVRLLDHIVIGGAQTYSFAEHGLI